MVFRTDLAELSAPTVDPDGSMIAHARLTRVGVFDYHLDGSVQRELRLPEEVFSPETMRSFRSRPVTDEHPHEMLGAKNWRSHTIGWLSGKPKRDADYVVGKLYFPDAEQAKRLWRQGRRQVSLGYSCSLEHAPGVHPQYGRYHVIQRQIRGNHVAIVDVARAGNMAAVRLDSSGGYCLDVAPAPIRRRSRVDGILGRGPVETAADQVDAQLRDDYPPGAREWVRQARWEGPVRVPLDRIDFSGAATWRASGEPDRVDAFASKIGGGWEKPVILCRRPGHQDLMVVDGHHRSLAYRKMGMQPLAYVADVDRAEGPWDEFHSSQREKDLALCNSRANLDAMANSQVKPLPAPKTGEPDPKDEASKNAAGDNDAKPSDKADPPPGPENERSTADDADGDDMPDAGDVENDDAKDDTDPDEDGKDGDADGDGDDDSGDEDPDESDADGDDTDEDVDDCAGNKGDAYDKSYNDDGDLTPRARHKMAASSFAVPDREGLPIHDPDHTKAAMSRFNQFEFKDHDEKHAAFNRIRTRAKHFGINSSGFEKANEDHIDSQDDMKKIALLQKQLADAQKRADEAEGRLDSVKKRSSRTDEDEVAQRVDARAALLAEARAVGATVDAKMTERAIKVAVIKHVDGADVPDGKTVAYVDGRYDSAVEGYRADAAKAEAGANAVATARAAAVVTPERLDATETRNDLAAAEDAARQRTAQAYRATPDEYSASYLKVKGNSPSALAMAVLGQKHTEN